MQRDGKLVAEGRQQINIILGIRLSRHFEAKEKNTFELIFYDHRDGHLGINLFHIIFYKVFRFKLQRSEISKQQHFPLLIQVRQKRAVRGKDAVDSFVGIWVPVFLRRCNKRAIFFFNVKQSSFDVHGF